MSVRPDGAKFGTGPETDPRAERAAAHEAGRAAVVADPASEVDDIAAALFGVIRELAVNARKARPENGLTAAEMAAMIHLKRAGQNTAAALARLEQITPQAMGATIAALESRGLIERAADPDDGRRVLLSLSDAGRRVMDARRTTRTAAMAQALATRYTPAELAVLAQAAPLLERLTEEF